MHRANSMPFAPRLSSVVISFDDAIPDTFKSPRLLVRFCKRYRMWGFGSKLQRAVKRGVSVNCHSKNCE